MTVGVLVDNDVLIKCACYSLLAELRSSTGTSRAMGVLGAARFVVRGYLTRRGAVIDRASALDAFETLLPDVVELEPTEEELALASLIEETATTLGLDLDGGESQLCAIAVHRGAPLLVTGDKRAIRDAERLLSSVVELSALEGCLVCLEQVILGIVSRLGPSATKSRICAEPNVDRSMSICFECSSSRKDFIPDGLTSYISHLRSEAPTLLYRGDQLMS